MAVADFGGTVLGKAIEVVSADMPNKADVGVGIARRWYEQEQVDLGSGAFQWWPRSTADGEVDR